MKKPRSTLFLLLVVLLLNYHSIMAQKEYVLTIALDNSKEEVWQAISDFKSYEKWNSVLSMRNNDALEIGKKFSVTIHNEGKDSRFKAKTLSKEENNGFSAQQKVLGKWFFSATHYFIIEALERSSSRVNFSQKWHLKGIVAVLFKKQIYKQLELFNTMNTELKAYLNE